ncbi:MAG: alpha/beta fold hydrolase [Polyangiaceae bacterium]|jgi:carboxylesterase
MFRDRQRTVAEQKMLGVGERELFAEGRAPCVVALHGFGGTVAELRPLLDALARAGYAVDAALLAGHGSRVEELQDLGFDAWLEGARARARAAREKHGRIVLLGFSLGSLVAMELASEQPEGLAGLVVLGNALTLAPIMRVPLELWHRTGRPLPDVYMLKPLAGDLVDRSAMERLVTYDRHPVRAALEVYLAGHRVRKRVDRIVCPTLILHGRRDRVCPWKNAVWLAEHIGARDVSVRLFEKSAHVLALDGERDEVAAEVLRFLERLG